MILDVDDNTRGRLAVSAARYAVGRRTYAAGCVADVLAANAGRFDRKTNMELRRLLDVPADRLGLVDLAAWRVALRRLEEAGPDPAHGLEGSGADLSVLLFCAFHADMGVADAAGMWLRLLDADLPLLDGEWRAVSARDLYEAGHAPQGAPEPPVQHLEPLGRAGRPEWADVYLRLVEAPIRDAWITS